MPSEYLIETPDGERIAVPRVSTYLSIIPKPGLNYWYARMEKKAIREALTRRLGKKITRQLIDAVVADNSIAGSRRLGSASDRGTGLHKAIELYLKGVPADFKKMLDESDFIVFNEWLKWWNKSGFEVYAIEKRVEDLDLFYAGTVDLIAKRKDRFTVIDWKTGSGIAPEAYLQNVAYRAALKKKTGIDADGLIVHVGEEIVEVPVSEKITIDWFADIVKAYNRIKTLPEYQRIA